MTTYWKLKVPVDTRDPSASKTELVERFKPLGVRPHNMLAHCKINNTSGNRFLREQQWTRIRNHVTNLFTPIVRENEQLEDVIKHFCEVREGTQRLPRLPKVKEDSKEERTDVNQLKLMTVYAKVLRLRDRDCQPPFSRKRIARVEEEEPEVLVYDELLVIRSLIFHSPTSITVEARRDDYTDLQPIYPPRKELKGLYHDRRPIGGKPLKVERGHLEHDEVEPLDHWQGAITFTNAFQRGQQYVGAMIEYNCDQLVMVVDLLSLPVRRQKLFITGKLPYAYHIRGNSQQMENKTLIAIEESAMGCFILDTSNTFKYGDGADTWDPKRDKILKKDKFEIHFPINWDAVIEAELETTY